MMQKLIVKELNRRIITDWIVDRLIEIACMAMIVFAVANIMWAIGG